METLPPVLTQVEKRFKSAMELESDSWYQVHFTSGEHEYIPPRAGYYLGQLVAQEVCRDWSWPETMKLKGDPLKEKTELALAELSEPTHHQNEKQPISKL